MAVVVNNPSNADGDGPGFFVGMVVLLVVVLLVVIYGIPYVRSSGSATSPAPQNNTSPAPQINVPPKVDVNVQGPSSGK